MKKKDRNQNQKNISIQSRNREPNKSFLNHLQTQANKMSELLGEKNGEQLIKDTLKEWPHLIKRELEIFKKN